MTDVAMTGATYDETGAGEIKALLNALRGQRRHILGIIDGLGPEALRRPVLPSGWSCLGLVQHLALDVERFWFQAVLTGDQPVIDSLDATEDAWQVAPDVPAADVLERYRRETDRADAIITATPADAPSPGGRTTSSDRRTCTATGTSCCTSSPRPPATPDTWTPPANSSTGGAGWCSRRIVRRTAPRPSRLDHAGLA